MRTEQEIRAAFDLLSRAAFTVPCPKCHGTGSKQGVPCSRCNATGWVDRG